MVVATITEGCFLPREEEGTDEDRTGVQKSRNWLCRRRKASVEGMEKVDMQKMKVPRDFIVL